VLPAHNIRIQLTPVAERIQCAMKTDAVIDAFGKNEQVKKVFWTLFVIENKFNFF
jgi:hypothetical protein